MTESLRQSPEEVEAIVSAASLLRGLSPDLLYHAPLHTLGYVYPDAMRLATAEGLERDERLAVAVSALFHDTGYLDTYNSNEEDGAHRALGYIYQKGKKVLLLQAPIIQKAIINTNMQSPPENIVEAILRDADLSVLGLPSFLELNRALRDEALNFPDSHLHKFALNDASWASAQLRFMQDHTWFTDAATNLYQEQKERNILAFKAYYADALS